MPITLEELAKKLNVSASTISRVVNNKSYVKPETRKKILKALKEYDYQPNQVARSLKNRVTSTVAVIVPDISEDFFAYAFKGIDEILSENGYTMLLCDTGENPAREEMYLSMLAQKQIDGIILATVSKDYTMLGRYIKNNVNIVFFDNLPNISLNFNSVITDNVKASTMVVDHLAKLGHKNIGIIVGKQDETTGFERLAGFKKAIAEHGLPSSDSLIAIGDFKEKSGYDCMKALLERNKDITAVYVTSSKMTYGAIKAITECGKTIPDDIALVGFDIRDPSGLIKPGITTVRQNEEYIGRTAGELLLKKLQDPSNTINHKILLEPQLVVRESCGSKAAAGCSTVTGSNTTVEKGKETYEKTN